jgi:hypothetical protein
MSTRQARQRGYRSNRITTATTTPVKTSSGILHALVVEVASAGITTVNDANGAKLILPAAWPIGLYLLDLECAGKIEIVTAGADRIVAIYD